MIRQCTIASDVKSTLLLLSIIDLNRMQMEFLEVYEKMIQDGYVVLECSLKYKLKAIKECQNQQIDYEKDHGQTNHQALEYKVEIKDIDAIVDEVSISECDSHN